MGDTMKLVQTAEEKTVQIRQALRRTFFENHYSIIIETILARRMGTTFGTIQAAKARFWAKSLSTENYVLIRRFWKNRLKLQNNGFEGFPEEISRHLEADEMKIAKHVLGDWVEHERIRFALPDVVSQYRVEHVPVDAYIGHFTKCEFSYEQD